jgi:tetratricopeptide (TPR) repeat protein
MNEDLRRQVAALSARGDHKELIKLATELIRAGDMPAAEAAARAARDAGSAEATPALAVALDHQGRVTEAEAAYREAIAAGDDSSLVQLADMLLFEDSRREEAEELARRGVERGAVTAQFVLGKILARWPGREAEAEAALRAEANPTVRPMALFQLGQLLIGMPGREADAEQALRDSSLPEALAMLASMLYRKPGREEEAIEALRRAAESGVPHAWNNLTVMLKELDRMDSAEAAYRDGINQGETELLPYFGDFLRLQGRREEAERVLRAGLAADSKCAHVLGSMLLGEPGRVDEGRELLIRAAGAGEVRAAITLARPR